MGRMCPFCQSNIIHETDYLICDLCQTPHHFDCWRQNGGCTTYGCLTSCGSSFSESKDIRTPSRERLIIDLQESTERKVHYGVKEFAYEKASGSRLLAAFIDLLIALSPALIFIGLAAFWEFVLSSEAFPWVLMLVANYISMLWFPFYYIAKDSFGCGQSWGKKICGLMVVRLSDNQPCSLQCSFLRNILMILFFIEFFVPLTNSKGQRIGDMLANTQVIDKVRYM